jgi:hypothetical protein
MDARWPLEIFGINLKCLARKLHLNHALIVSLQDRAGIIEECFDDECESKGQEEIDE